MTVEQNRKSDSGVVSPTDNTGVVVAKESSSRVVTTPSVCSDDLDSQRDSSSSSSHTEPNSSPDNALSDSGQGSEADDATVMAYNFKIPSYLCGKLIGIQGQNVKNLKAKSKCGVHLKEVGGNFGKIGGFRNHKSDYNSFEVRHQVTDYQICILNGTRAAIDKCLELIREK